jgi:hypothetical protein
MTMVMDAASMYELTPPGILALPLNQRRYEPLGAGTLSCGG